MVSMVHSCFNGFREPTVLVRFGAYLESINNDLNVVVFVSVQTHALDQVHQDTIDTNLNKTLFGDIIK